MSGSAHWRMSGSGRFPRWILLGIDEARAVSRIILGCSAQIVIFCTIVRVIFFIILEGDFFSNISGRGRSICNRRNNNRHNW
jgi:hypothetical protein